MPNKSLLLINALDPEHRVALLEDGSLVEFYLERTRAINYVGNIYKGRVVRVLPGMQAAFVDIGLEKAAFLHVSDIVDARRDVIRTPDIDDRDEDDGDSYQIQWNQDHREVIWPGVDKYLKPGQDVMVQVSKNPIGTKGVRVSGYISLPSRHLVYMPYVDHVGVSRKITDEAERQRLREIAESMRPGQGGIIVRTAAEGQSAAKLRSDMDYLMALWRDVQNKFMTLPAPSLLHQELDLVLKCVRDLFSPEVEACLVDSEDEFHRIREFVAKFMPRYLERVELYEGHEPILAQYDVESQIDQALERKVWLKSGGYIVFDRTEALTAIDVNTGSFVGQRNLEDTITKINLEAAREIADQLRRRNIGGLIIIDFIDMEKESNRIKVMEALEEALSKDRARYSILPLSEFGLIQMTRKRTQESLLSMMTEPCPYCGGKGYVRSRDSICASILRNLRQDGGEIPGRTIKVLCHRDIAELLTSEYQDFIETIELRLGKWIIVHPSDGYHMEEFHILPGDL